jgi:hypothetical protein
MRAISDHARGDDFGTKGDRGLPATRVPQVAARLGTGNQTEPRVRKPLRAREIAPRASAEEIGGPECEQAKEVASLARCEGSGQVAGAPLP